ncbi:MAG TPA: DUF4434 domain-containing protein [Armatimonadota bacterium]|nr:DUF4434 domain-containing protein [Armatimonadota bacterium]
MAKITGTFIDFAVGLEYAASCTQYPERLTQPGFWDRELADMRAAGITEVILARIMELGRTHYHSPLFQEWDREDHTALIMRAAEEQGMRVWLGGHLNLAFWDRTWDFTRMMQRDLNVNVAIFTELWAQYEGHPALAGFYVSNEPDYDNLDTPERADALRRCLHGIYEVIKRESGLPVLVSPFFSKSLPPAALAAWWDAYLDRPMFDVLAMQDGVGCFPRRDLHAEEIPPYYAALAPVYARHGITFWNNVETFASPWPTPGPLERIDRQYAAGTPYTARAITWEYGHFLGRQQVGEERYAAFTEWNLAEEG